MDDLIVFLKARFDEDEQTARSASPGPWANAGYGDFGWGVAGPAGGSELEDSEQGKADAEHMARHDPARVLREVESRRGLLTEHYVIQGTYEGRALRVCKRCSDYVERGELFRPEPAPCRTLRLLALPYAGHEDYRGEWRP